MYVGHYKSVASSGEFYSEARETLDFPTQVEFQSERYMLTRTVQVSTPSQRNRFIAMVTGYDIKYDVKVD